MSRLAGPLKLAVGVGLLVWMFSAGAIPLDRVVAALRDLPSLALNAAALAVIVLFLGLRWKRLALAAGVDVPLPRYFAMTMVSGLFGMVGAGSVGGDAIRAWYLADESDAGRATVIVVADRIVSGATSLVLAALLWYAVPVAHDDTRLTAVGVALATAALGALAVAALVFFLPLPSSLLRTRWAQDVERARLAYRGRAGDLAVAAFYTACSVAATTALYWLQGERLGIDVSLALYAKVVPATLMAAYLSFVPFGLGVGQLALWGLFAWTGAAAPSQATALVTVLQTYAILLHAAIGILSLWLLRRAPAR